MFVITNMIEKLCKDILISEIVLLLTELETTKFLITCKSLYIYYNEYINSLNSYDIIKTNSHYDDVLIKKLVKNNSIVILNKIFNTNVEFLQILIYYSGYYNFNYFYNKLNNSDNFNKEYILESIDGIIYAYRIWYIYSNNKKIYYCCDYNNKYYTQSLRFYHNKGIFKEKLN